MRIVRGPGSGNYEPKKDPDHPTIGMGIILNANYTADGSQGLSVTYDPQVLDMMEKNLLSGAAGRQLGALAVFWENAYSNEHNYPEEL